MMIESTDEDPLTQAHMVFALEQVYEEHKLRVPNRIKKYLSDVRNKLSIDVNLAIKEKRYEYQITLDDKERSLRNEQFKIKRIEEESQLNKLTRTQQIFGTDKEKDF